ncbi:MAG: two-component system response regulator [Anaerolineae bacterium]|jgi:CheY-like chemotaxis protein
MSQPLAFIVDDHGDSAAIFSEAMRIAGFAIKVIQSGSEALARLEETSPDVVVLDLCLPGVAGTEILQRIRAEERLAKAHVIVVSADPILAGDTMKLADQVLIKPIGFIWLRDLALELAGKLSARTKQNR